MTGNVRLILTFAALAASITCASPTDVPEPQDPPTTLPPGQPPVQPPVPPPPIPTPVTVTVASVEIAGPDTLLVNQSSLLSVTARDAQGGVITPTPASIFLSSDQSVLNVSDFGVISAVGRGTAVISVIQDTVTAHLTVVVRARAILVLPPGQEWQGEVLSSTGDSLQFTAKFVDVNGMVIGAAPATGWQSSDPSAVSVDAAGLAIALRASVRATITASTPEGVATTTVLVSATVTGLPATVRFVHAVQGAGPITFRPNRLPPVTLAYGQSVDLATTSGTFYVETGAQQVSEIGGRTFYALMNPGDALSLYFVGTPNQNLLAVAWGTTDPIPADSGLVRLIQSSSFQVVFLRDTGAPKAGLPETCYFDLTDPTPYYPRAAGPFDLLLQKKPRYSFDPTDTAFSRVAASVQAGHAVTLVLTGNSPATAGYLAFTDR